MEQHVLHFFSQFRKAILATTPWYQNPCGASIFLHARELLERQMKKLNLTLLRHSPLKIEGHILKFYV